MKIILSPEASADLDQQIDYLLAQHAVEPAHRLKSRIADFLANHLAVYPLTGRFIAHRHLWECWVPGTRLVVWYRVNDDRLEIARFWHTSRNRHHADDADKD